MRKTVVRTQISKWGNSLAVRIPGPYVKDLSLSEGMNVDIAVIGRKLVVRPVSQEITLQELVDRITPENCHGETDWGPAIGNESW
jgi:antitoxin MazE